jgi:hypothetical protein
MTGAERDDNDEWKEEGKRNREIDLFNPAT